MPSRIDLWPRVARVDPSTLTTRQREIAQLIAEGHTMASIAGFLRIDDKTVYEHLSNLESALGLPQFNAALITRYAVFHGMVEA